MPGRGRRRSSAKATPFSVRLPETDDAFIQAEAKRLGRPRGTIVSAYTAEAIRTRRYPGIAFRGEDHRRRAWVVGTGLDVWELVSNLRDFGSESAFMAEYPIKPMQLRIALAYYDEFQDEIDEEIRAGRSSLEELSQQYPFIQTFEAATAGALG